MPLKAIKWERLTAGDGWSFDMCGYPCVNKNVIDFLLLLQRRWDVGYPGGWGVCTIAFGF